MNLSLATLKDDYLSNDPDEIAVSIIKRGFLPFRVTISTPLGDRQALSIIAKSSANAMTRAIEMLYPDDSAVMPRGMTISVKSLMVD